MKKCGSCTKDLPDAALHCVFCGAKQAPSPAAQPGMAKTVMGYGANEELNALREKAAAANAARTNPVSSPPPSMPAPAPYNAPRPQSASQPPPAGYAPPGQAGAQAPTMFAGAPPAVAGPRPGPQPMNNPPMGGGPMGGPPMGGGPMNNPPMGGPVASGPQGYNPQPAGGYNPQPAGGYNPPPAAGYHPQPVQPIPSAAPPYMASGNTAQAARPIEPWKDTLRLTMFIWGGVLLACFALPLSFDPLAGWWNVIAEAPGTAKLVPLLLAAVGLLSIVVGAIPMATGPRGMIASVLALAGIFVPMFIVGSVQWQSLVSSVGIVLLVPGLLLRTEYTESPMPRILITAGALAALVPFVVPAGGSVPVVELFKALIDAPGALKIVAALFVVYVVVIVLTLLAWLPSPATAGAKPLAWVLMLYPLVIHAAMLFLVGDPSMIEKTPNQGILGWAYGGGIGGGGLAVGGMTLGTAYLVIHAYGSASFLGKQLE